jgi:membrane protein
MEGKVKSFLSNLYCRFQDDEVPAMGAQLTYYLILSFFPFLIFLVSVVSFMDMAPEKIINGITRIMPSVSNKTISEALGQIRQSRSTALLSIGMIATIWSASNGVGAVMKALNKAYDEEETRKFIQVKGLSALFTVILAVVILLSFVLLVFGKIIGEQIFKFLHMPGYFEIIWGIAQYLLPLTIMAAVFVILYRYLPNRRLTFKEVLPGAVFATLGWTITSVLFSFYVNNFGNYTKTYGSLGGIIVLLTWLYMSSVIIVLGGEVNAVFAFDREGKQRAVCKRFALQIPFRKKKDADRKVPETIKPLYR